MKYLVIEAKSKGCASCIATIIPHLLKIPGVKGARVIGRKIIVLLGDSVDYKSIVENGEVRKYYDILSWSLVEDLEILSKEAYKLH